MVPGKAVASGPTFTTGAWLAIVAVVVTGVLANPLESVTVRLTVYWPSGENVWLGVAPVPENPSPKFHAYVSGTSPSRSVDEMPLKATVPSEVYGPPGFAMGAWLMPGIGPRQLPLPESRKVFPATGMYSHV